MSDLDFNKENEYVINSDINNRENQKTTIMIRNIPSRYT